MIANPIFKDFPRQRAGRETQEDLFLFLNGRDNFKAVKQKKRLHCRVANSLISVDKGMIHD